MTQEKMMSKNDNTYRRTKTGALFVSWICHGVYNEVIGPTIPDIISRVGCNYEQISRVLSAREAGLFLGSLVGGVVHDRWARKRDILIAVALIISAITVSLTPWCTSLWMLAAVFYVMGHGHALLSTGGNPTITVLWNDKSDGPYQLLHMGFGIGAILGILISKPFISDHSLSADGIMDNISLPTNNNDSWLKTLDEEVVTLQQDSMESHIEYTYGIAGILCALASTVFIAYYFIRTPLQFIPKQSKWRDILNPRRCSGGQTMFGAQILFLIFIFYMFIVGMERGFGRFIFSYAVKSRLSLSKDAAAWLGMFFWISFTFGRFSSFLLSRCVAPHVLLFMQLSGTLCASILLCIFPDNGIAIFVLTIVFGFFKSQLYPTGFGWANRYIEISSMTVTVIDTGSSIGGIIVQWLTGYTFQYYGPHTFLYVILICAAASFLIFIAMHIIASRQGERFASTEEILKETKSEEANGLIDCRSDLENCKNAERDLPPEYTERV